MIEPYNFLCCLPEIYLHRQIDENISMGMGDVLFLRIAGNLSCCVTINQSKFI